MAKNKRNKPNVVRLVALILCILLAGTAIVGELISIAYAQSVPENRTEMELTMEEGAQGLRAFQVTDYVNQTGKRLTQVVFSLAGNCFRRISAVPFDSETIEKAFPNGFNTGGIQIDSVKVNGKNADWGIVGKNETFLRVACDILQGDTAKIEFSYLILLPEARGFLGTGDMGWRLSSFLPEPCVFDETENDFVMVDVSPIGDSAFHEKQNYTIRVIAPDTYWIAGGGTQERALLKNGYAKTVITLTDASCAALALGRRYTLYWDHCGDVEIECYTNTCMGAKRALEYAKKALSVYCDQLGEFPGNKVCIVQTDEIRDVSAYDGLLMIDSDLFRFGKGDQLESAIAYGLAKQWFGLAVQANPETDPWLSDAVCEYVSALYYESAYDHVRFLKVLNDKVLNALNITVSGRLTPDAQKGQFQSASTYDIIVRQRGCAVLHEMRLITGKDGFWNTLKTYYENNMGKIATTEDFEKALLDANNRDLSKALYNHMNSISEYVNQSIEWFE